MIKVSVLYPNGPDVNFDMDYYCNTHIPMVVGKLGSALKSGAVEAGLCGATADDAPHFVAMGHLTFDAIEDFEASFGPHAEEILADIPNFTNAQPIIQISDVKI